MVACMTPCPTSPSAPASVSISSSDAARLGTGRPASPTWVGDFEVAKPSAPARSASRTSARMAAISSAVASRSLASSPSTCSRTGVWPTSAPTLIAVPRRLDRVEELGEALERPVAADAREQRVERHALDALERAQHQLAVRRSRGGDAEAAVAHDDRRDPVPGRDRQHAVPEDLGVVVRVDVDEAGRDDRALGVERAAGGAADVAQRGDAAATDAEVAAPRRGARAVDQRAAADQEVEVLGHGRRRAR